jgi:glycosyltransferase involved in cell wall biosynthesis
MSTTSLIIATYNWPEALNVCLLSIRNQTVLPAEVIVADDGSTMETKMLIEKMKLDFPVPLIHVWHQDLGFRKSLILNKAVRTATGKYIVQVDGDVILDKNFIADHERVAETGFFVRGTRTHIHKDVVKSVCKEEKIDFNYFSPNLVHRFNALRLPFLAFLMEKKSKTSHCVRGSNLAFWRSDFVLVNGYDNDLTGWGHEDEELATRFVNIGVWKKAVKFKCIQFHLYHEPTCNAQKPSHIEALSNTQQQKLKACNNGIAQS